MIVMLNEQSMNTKSERIFLISMPAKCITLILISITSLFRFNAENVKG